jgi:hypothetical protein
MKVFISWSGSRSKDIATALRALIGTALPGSEPWMSDTDIQLGTPWFASIGRALEESSIGLVAVTPENVREPWLYFEGGAIAKSVTTSRLMPVLFGVSARDLAGPFAQFQCAVFGDPSMRRLLLELEALLQHADRRLLPLDERLAVCWPTFSANVTAILSRPPGPGADSDEQADARGLQWTSLPTLEQQILIALAGGQMKRELSLTSSSLATLLRASETSIRIALSALTDRSILKCERELRSGALTWRLADPGRKLLSEGGHV